MKLIRKIRNWYATLGPGHGKARPPYDHIVQIGDPILRRVAEEVPIEKIQTDEVQTVINRLANVLNRYEAAGLAAPQIGISMRIFIMQFLSRDISNLTPEVAKLRNASKIPLSVYINPTVKIIDYQKIVLPEGCESVRGYMADVARFKEVEVTGYNELGQKTTRTYKDWSARIVQHEMDHLNGVIYTDLMDKKTLACICWEEINKCKGRLVIPYRAE